MMHENNRKTITNWKPENFAEAYRDYMNNWACIAFWMSSYMPEEFKDEEMYDFYEVCKKFHNLGF